MNAIPKPAADLLQQTGQLSESVTRPIPGSRKIFVEGSRADLQVPMREIALTQTPTIFGGEENPPVTVYDTSGPYTDPGARIDLAAGLPALRAKWIEERGDTEPLEGLSSTFGRAREHDPKLDAVRFPNRVLPRRAKAGANVSQMHYARRGIVTPEMEYVAIRENQRLDAVRDAMLLKQHPGEAFGASIPKFITPEFVRDEIARGRAILPNNINHPESEPMIIGRNLYVMAELKVPVIVTIIGEGGSGGALAIAVGDTVQMLQYSTYSVISPEGCASILWKSAEKAPEAAETMGITAHRLKTLGLIDKVVSEPLGGAHRDHAAMAQNLKKALQDALKQLAALSTTELLATRYERLMSYGRFKEQAVN